MRKTGGHGERSEATPVGRSFCYEPLDHAAVARGKRLRPAWGDALAAAPARCPFEGGRPAAGPRALDSRWTDPRSGVFVRQAPGLALAPAGNPRREDEVRGSSPRSGASARLPAARPLRPRGSSLAFLATSGPTGSIVGQIRRDLQSLFLQTSERGSASCCRSPDSRRELLTRTPAHDCRARPERDSRVERDGPTPPLSEDRGGRFQRLRGRG